MWRVGVSFESNRPADEVRRQTVQPLGTVLFDGGWGIQTDHLEQPTGRQVDGCAVIEHLLVCEVHDFERALRFLRSQLEPQADIGTLRFHNLTDNRPIY
ncbi:MAG: hypothetical protein U0795_08625 [Pirellulales bacterium]